MKKLNIGCGSDIRKGWVNLDTVRRPGVDLVCDLEQTDLPFKDDEVDFILCQDILEQIEYIPVLEELYRVLRKNGRIKIRVPHFTSANNYINPTHKKVFSARTFLSFVKDSKISKDLALTYHFSKAKKIYITFPKGIYVLNLLIEPLVNISQKTRNLYEDTFLCRLFQPRMLLLFFRNKQE